jgi:hypothetical protein
MQERQPIGWRRLNMPLASVEEHYSDWTRLVREISRGSGSLPVTCDLSVLRRLAECLRAADGKITVSFEESVSELRVRDV